MGWLWNSTADPSTADSSADPSTADPSTADSSGPPPPPPPPPTHHPSSPRTPITPHTTLPTTLSCRSTFDAAFYCQSVGGQFANIYRYGSLRSCSEQWGDFWFCVRTNRGLGGEEGKREAIRQWAAEKERGKYGRGGDEFGRGNSEDVWERRRWMVRGAFEGDWGVLERESRERGEELEGVEEGR